MYMYCVCVWTSSHLLKQPSLLKEQLQQIRQQFVSSRNSSLVFFWKSSKVSGINASCKKSFIRLMNISLIFSPAPELQGNLWWFIQIDAKNLFSLQAFCYRVIKIPPVPLESEGRMGGGGGGVEPRSYLPHVKHTKRIEFPSPPPPKHFMTWFFEKVKFYCKPTECRFLHSILYLFHDFSPWNFFLFHPNILKCNLSHIQ